jgi:hypothetical protein
MMALFTMMLFPMTLFSQGTGASNYPISFWYVSWTGSSGYNTEIPINSTNEDDVLGDGPTSPTVKFKYNSTDNTGTLTLNGMNFNGWIESELDELIIEFTGTNRLSGTGGTGNNGYIRNKKTSGDATLTLIPANSSSTLYIHQETASYSVVDGFTLNLDGGAIPTYPSYSSPFFFDSSTKQYKYGDIPSYPLLETITFTATPSYMVWIGGSGASGISQATGLATDATFASANVTSGTASFDSSTNTLTLTDAALSGDIWSALDNLTINLKGSNSMTHDNYGGADSPISSINSGTLNIETTDGTGSLTFLNTSGSSYTDPIGGFLTVTYDDHLDLVKNSANQDEIMVAYKLWVAGKRVTGSNASNVLNDGTVSYNAATNKLTLNHAQLDEGIWTTMADLNIHFIGNDCWISPNAAKPSNCILSLAATPGTLKFTKENDGDKLELYNSRQGYTAIRGFNAIDDVNGLPLETQNPYKIVNDGYYRLRREITNSLDTATTNIDYAIVSADEVYPLWLSSKQVTSANASNIIGWGSYDSGTKTLTLTGLLSDVTGSSGNPYYGVTTGVDNLTVKLVALVGDRNYIKCRGTDDIAFKGYGNASTITFSPDASNPGSLEMYVANSDGAHWFEGVTPSYSSSLAFHDDGYDGSTFYVSRIAPVTNYDLWIDGTQVTSLNAGTITSGVSYDEVENELTLDNTNTVAVKTGLADLKVKLLRHVYFYSGSKSVFEGVNGTEKLTFTTDPTTPGYYDIDAANGIFKNISTNNITYQNDLRYWRVNEGGVSYKRALILQVPWEGLGTSAAPYHISNTDNLTALATLVNRGCIIDDYFDLNVSELDCSGLATFPSIGNYARAVQSFDGTFDGKGGKISNLTSPYGLFNYIGGNCVIKDLTLDNSNVQGSSSDNCVAGLVAQIRTSSAEINNCHVVNSSISSGNNANITSAGGIVGYQYSSTVTGCSVKNSTITLTQQDRTYDQNAGGISAYFYQGTISNCVVEGTTISSQNTGNKELYSGAIVGKKGSSLTTLSNNTYDAAVQVKSKKGSEDEIVRNGNTQRGIGYDESSNEKDYDVFDDGAVLAGVKKMTLSVNADGGSATVSGYYRAVGSDYYSLPTCSLTVKGTPNADYDIPALTLTDPSTNTDYTPGIPSGGADTESLSWSFPMPSVDLSGQMDFKIRLNKLGRVFTIDDFTYNGSGQGVTQIKTKKTSTSTNEITLSLTNGDVSFVEYQDVDGISLASTYNQTNPPSDADDYKISITAGNKTTGSCTVDYTIKQASLADASIADIDDQTYTGSAITPEPTVTFNGAVLTKGRDFKYNYSNNTNVADKNGSSAPTVTIEGLGGNFLTTPTNSKTFTIAQADFSTTTSLSIAAVTAQTYTGSEIKPTPTVTFNGKALTATVDFDYGYTNHKDAALSTDAAAPTVTVTGKGNFKGISSVTFTIDQADFSLMSTPLTIATVSAETYTGSEIKPTPTVTFGSTQLTAGTDFDYSYANNTNAALSTATPAPTVTINGKGNFKGAKSVVFTIDQVDLSTSTDIAVDAVPDQIYTGSPITPTPTVKFNGNDLVAGAGNDFVYSYLNNTNAALSTDPTAPPTVTITGSGNFKNSTSVKFTILDRTASVTFGSGQTYKTFFSAGENLLVPNDVKAYVVTMVSGNTVNLTQISYIHSNVPVLLESSAGATNVKDPNESLPATNLLKYASAAVSTDGNQYVLYSDEFVKATGTIPAGRVYLAYSSPVRRLTIERNNSATAIEVVSDEDAGDEQWYDMQGRKINKPTKDGLYIKNGKKVVVNNK